MNIWSETAWYSLVSLWGVVAGGVCLFHCAHSKSIRAKTYVGNFLLTVVMGALYTFLPLMVIGSNTTKPMSTYLLAVYLVAFVLGIVLIKLFVSMKTPRDRR